MLGVEVKDNESVERAINRFKKMVTRSRILKNCRWGWPGIPRSLAAFHGEPNVCIQNTNVST